MVDIDERVVSMKFDSSDFEKNTKSTMSILDKLHEKLSFKDVGDEDSLNAITENVQKMADKAYTIVDRMIDKIKDNIANKLVNFLQENTIGQFKSGWDKYADMTTSVATLKAQGYSMEVITEQLERLNYFSDETSYSFTDMVREIGKFTASGQSLEDATTAMMGIADWAALSGKNASEASRAMYQLSQALGSGKMRKEDWKSIQNLNMDTKEFRENAIQAAIEMGTLKETSEGVYQTLVGKKANKLSFTVQQFADNLTEGEWFTADVMMKVYSQYSEAVDQIRDLYLEHNEEIPTAEIVRQVKDSNNELIDKFKDKGISSKDANTLLNKWRKIEKVTDETVKNYAKVNKLTEEQARTNMNKEYAEYLEEYSKIFKDSEKNAEEALDDWKTYVSEFGIKAFLSAQEAKTFRDAIESAKDAASSVWTSIYTSIFGDYEEAKELWTDLANALYDIFVSRLWKIAEIFEYWKTGYEDEKKEELAELKKEYDELGKSGNLDAYGRERLKQLKAEITEMETTLEAGMYNGRRILFQGLYAFGSGLKSALGFFRDAWDETFEENETGNKLIQLSDKIRYDGFRFYTMMQELGETDFYKNIAQGIRNLFAPFKGAIEVIKAVINSFLPAKKTTKDMLVTMSEAFKNFTEKLVPSQETLQKIAKILRGIVSVIRLLAKAAYGLWIGIIKPILTVIVDAFSAVFGNLLDILASMADGFYGFENALEPMEAMQLVAEALHLAFDKLAEAIKTVVSIIWDLLGPAISFIVRSFKDLFERLKKLLTGGKGNMFTNMANGLKNVSTRAKAAWKSTESFADIFDRFKEGKGISNVVELLGTLLDNLIIRIGRTIAAIFGLEDVLSGENSKIGTAFNDVKSSLNGVFTVLKWIYMNVIRPTLEVMVGGVANMIREIGDAWARGDIMKILEIITKTFKALGALQLFKVLQVLSRTFGSAGIIKVLRNGAKALKSLSKWLGAKAVNEVASAIFKLVAAFTLLLGVLSLMSLLPTENLEKVSNMLIYAGIALGVMMVAMTTLSIVATKTRWGLVGIAGSMIAIVAATWTFIFVIEKIRTAVENFKEEVDGIGGVLLALLPVISVLVSMFIVFKAAAKIGNSGGLLSFGAGIMALGVAVAALTFACNAMVNFIHNNKTEEILGAILSIIVIMTTVAAASGLMLRIVGSSFSGIRKSSAAIAMSLSIITVALVTALVVIPLLEEMVRNADKFPQYVQALAIFCTTMISISASFALMTSRTKGGFHMLAAGLVFKIFVNTIQTFIIPMLETIKGLHLDEYIGGIITLAAVLLAISFGVKLLMEGIARIIEAISKINAKTWLAIILSTGAVIAGIILLTHYLESTGTDISVGAVFAAIGVMLGVIVAFGIFANSLVNATGGSGYAIGEIAKVFKWMAILVTSIMVGLTLAMVAIKLFYDDDYMDGITTIGLFAAIVLGTIALTLLAFGIWIKKVSDPLKSLTSDNLTKTTNMIKAIFLGMTAMMLTLGGLAIVLGLVFDDVWDYLSPLFGIVSATLVAIGGVLLAIGVFLNLVPTIGFNKHACIMVIAALSATLLDILAIGLILVPAFEDIRNVDWKIILAVLGGVALIIIAIGALVAITSSANESKKAILGIAAALGSLLVVAVLLPILAYAFERFDDIGWDGLGIGLAALLAPLLILIGVAELFDKTNIGKSFLTSSLEIAAGIAAISAALILLGLAVAMIVEIFSPGSTWLSNGFNLMAGTAEGIKAGSRLANKEMENAAEGLNKTFTKEEQERSPSKLYKKYGKFIDMGLAQGITKNRKIALKASKALAIFTNESFCEELGIESPSKVFYENGRFVVRGFINGLNDEANKNKQAGADMAAGFADGMDDMMDDMSSKWKGLWSELGMEDDIRNAIENGTEGAGSIFANELLSEITGENQTVISQLSAAEAQQVSHLKGLRSQRAQLVSEFNKNWTGPHDDSYTAALNQFLVKKGIPKDLDKQIEDLETKAGKTIKKNSGLSGLFSSIFGDTFTNLSKDGNFLDKIKEFGSSIGDGISDVFKTDGSGFNTLKETGQELLNMFGLGGLLKTDANSTGNAVASQVGGGIDTFLTGKTFTDTMTEAGNSIGNAVKNGIEEVLTKYNPFANIKLMYDTLMEYFTGSQRKNANNGLTTNVEDFANKNQETIDRLEAENKRLEAIKPANAKEAEEITRQIFENRKALDKLKSVSTKKVTYEMNNEDMHKTINNLLNDSQYNWSRDTSKIIDESGSNILHNIFGKEEMKEMLTDFWTGGGYSAQLGRRMKSVTDLGNDYAYYDAADNLHFTDKGASVLLAEWYYEIGAITEGEYLSAWKELAENDVLGYTTSFLDTWNKNHGSILDEYLDLIKDVKDESGQKSPSKVWAQIATYDGEGYMRGFSNIFPKILDMVVDDTKLLNDSAKNGLQAMSDSLNEEIEPTITPVFNGIDDINNIGLINNAINGINPAVQATVDSFQDDTPNYNGAFNYLTNQVATLTGVVNGFMQMVAEGDIVTVNVNAEADTNNLYNFIVDSNRQRFRQTGKNPLAY